VTLSCANALCRVALTVSLCLGGSRRRSVVGGVSGGGPDEPELCGWLGSSAIASTRVGPPTTISQRSRGPSTGAASLRGPSASISSCSTTARVTLVAILWREEREGLPRPEPHALGEAELNTIGYVVSRCGKMNANDLERPSHTEGRGSLETSAGSVASPTGSTCDRSGRSSWPPTRVKKTMLSRMTRSLPHGSWPPSRPLVQPAPHHRQPRRIGDTVARRSFSRNSNSYLPTSY
jgi:hypothetical protein